MCLLVDTQHSTEGSIEISESKRCRNLATSIDSEKLIYLEVISVCPSFLTGSYSSYVKPACYIQNPLRSPSGLILRLYYCSLGVRLITKNTSERYCQNSEEEK